MWEIYKNGPVVMSFKAPIDLGFYSQGIYSPVAKSKLYSTNHFNDPELIEVNHSVLVYGWGVANGIKFWRI